MNNAQNGLQGYGQEFVVEEGDELVQYIMVELPSSVQDENLQPGAELVLQGMDEDSPRLLLPDGTQLQGAYEETLGTTLLFRNPAAQQQEADGQQGAAQQGQSQKQGLFLGLSETRLVFKPAAAPPSAVPAAATAAAAATALKSS